MTLPIAGDPYMPSFVPNGYQLTQRVEGKAAHGFGFVDGQLGYLFRNGSDKDAWINPLAVYVGQDNTWSLSATENHAGEATDLGRNDITAVYHDGLWVPGAVGSEVRQTQNGGVLSWLQAGVHSLTVRWSGGIWAVRGSSAIGVAKDDLVQMAQSINFA
jgi:hypothetical protein